MEPGEIPRETSDMFADHDPNRLNLDDYFPYSSSFNTVVYVHKRFHNQKETKKEKPKKKYVKTKGAKEDKAVSCNIKDKIDLHDESVVNQTIRFAKKLAPQVIPLENSNVVYTVKACSKPKKKKKSPSHKEDRNDDIAIEKKKIIETYRNEKPHKHSYSGRDSSSSQCNTLDDLNNQSLSYTLSNSSEKHRKSCHKRARREQENFAISESFEGLAEINDNGETRIKLQLMSDKEKQNLIESLQIPIVEAVQDCVSKLNNVTREEIKSVQRTLRNNEMKLDTVIDRLACIEKYLANKVLNSPRPKTARVSRLDQLSEDLDEKRYSSEEDLPKLDSNRCTSIKELELGHDDRVENLGCGELGMKASTSIGVRTEKPNRLPARFCWTDSKMN